MGGHRGEKSGGGVGSVKSWSREWEERGGKGGGKGRGGGGGSEGPQGM